MTREGGVADTVKILIYSLITMQNLSNPHSNWLLLITVTTANVVVLSQCFIQIPKHWTGNEECWGRPLNEDRMAENRGRRPRAGVVILGMGQQTHSPPVTRSGAAL